MWRSDESPAPPRNNEAVVNQVSPHCPSFGHLPQKGVATPPQKMVSRKTTKKNIKTNRLGDKSAPPRRLIGIDSRDEPHKMR